MNGNEDHHDEGGLLKPGTTPLNPSTADPRLDLYQRMFGLAMSDAIERFRQMEEAWHAITRAIEGTTFALSDAERARRVDTLRREAAAALGRGDLNDHRKKLAELRRIERGRP